MATEQAEKKRDANLHPFGVGMPYWLLLNEFGLMVHRVFGTLPFLVGSALHTKEPRDIDVRLIISDEQFHDLFRAHTLNQPLTAWADTCLVWSHYGTRHVGKLIDFQILNDTHNILYHGEPRLPLGYAPMQPAVEAPESTTHDHAPLCRCRSAGSGCRTCSFGEARP